ncbi:hypothetical protein QAD02_013132 [Eretmocerus hayati]|uniref:Uncharacterized protein n=1 Tax=Eretmocerus hayati TaxID=131215 RepID=A0ACC2P1R9_9HYME|nr:hypothetical protein QAD02_013132 [Eretmocerus hayati]
MMSVCNDVIRLREVSGKTLSAALSHIEESQLVDDSQLSFTVYRNAVIDDPLSRLPDVKTILTKGACKVFEEWEVEVCDGVSQPYTSANPLRGERAMAMKERMLSEGAYAEQLPDESEAVFAKRAMQVAHDRGDDLSRVSGSSPKMTAEQGQGIHTTGYARDLGGRAVGIENYLGELTESLIHFSHYYLGKVQGVNVPTSFIGGAGSGTHPHLEDLDSMSMNYLIFGWKAWDGMHRSQYVKLKAALDKIFGVGEGHNIFYKPGFWLSPELLDRLGIEATCFIQGEYDLVKIHPDVIHWVRNITLTFAQAANYVRLIDWMREQHLVCGDHETGNIKRNYEEMPRLVGLEVTVLERTGMTCGICRDREFEQEAHYVAHMAQHGLHMVKCRFSGCGLQATAVLQVQIINRVTLH